MGSMSDLGDRANRAGQRTTAMGYGGARNARFLDPWKQALGKIADARLDQVTGGWRRPIGPAKPLNALSNAALRGIRMATIGNPKKGQPGPAYSREQARWHTPQEFTPQGIEEQLNTQRSQTQPGDRGAEHSAEGNLSNEQFTEQHRAQFGPELSPGSNNPFGNRPGPVNLGPFS